MLVFAASCGGDSSAPEENGSGSTLTATVDGITAFAANLSLTSTRSSGNVSFVAEQNAGQGTIRKIILTVANVTGPGTYTFAAPTTSSVGLYYETAGPVSKVWSSALTGGSGTVTVTQLTSVDITGTFSFTAPPSTGATENKVLTNGNFHVIFPQQQ